MQLLNRRHFQRNSFTAGLPISPHHATSLFAAWPSPELLLLRNSTQFALLLDVLSLQPVVAKTSGMRGLRNELQATLEALHPCYPHPCARGRRPR